MPKRTRRKASANKLHWQNTSLPLAIDGLVEVGRLYGDDPDLMRAKAHRVYELLRTITDQVPRRETRATPPPGLTPKQHRQAVAAIRKALDALRDTALVPVAGVLMSVIYDLCTSTLAPERRQNT
jgi:hypothetical protein